MSAAPIHPGPFEGAPPLTPAEVKAIVAACFADTNNALSTNPDGTITIMSPLTGVSVTTTPHPELTAGDGITIVDNVITSTVVDTDTDTRTVCTFALVGGELVKTTTVIDADGNPVGAPVVETIPLPTVPKYNACDIDGNVTSPAPDDTAFLTDAVANVAVQNGAVCVFDKDGAIIETIQPNMRRFPVNVSGIKTVAVATDPVGTVVKAAEFTLTVPGKSVQRVPFHFILGLETAGNATGDGSWNFRARISTNGATNGAPGFSNMRNHGADSFRTLNVQGENRQEWWTFIDLAPGAYPIRMEYFVLGIAGDAGPVNVGVSSAYADTHLFT